MKDLQRGINTGSDNATINSKSSVGLCVYSFLIVYETLNSPHFELGLFLDGDIIRATHAEEWRRMFVGDRVKCGQQIGLVP
jgi:hypothetical protein